MAGAPRATLVSNGSALGQRVMYWCPGCEHAHQIVTPTWGWNESLDRPTFTPSVLVQGGPDDVICHSFVTDGRIEYLGDSTHPLAGQTLDLPPWPPTFEADES